MQQSATISAAAAALAIMLRRRLIIRIAALSRTYIPLYAARHASGASYDSTFIVLNGVYAFMHGRRPLLALSQASPALLIHATQLFIRYSARAKAQKRCFYEYFIFSRLPRDTCRFDNTIMGLSSRFHRTALSLRRLAGLLFLTTR